MSLLISIELLDPISKEFIKSFEITEPGRDLAGLERWRDIVYGSKEFVDFGAVYLPKLKESDLVVHGEELEKLEQEILRILPELPILCKDMDAGELDVESRLQNILWATRKAKELNGAIVVS